MPQLQNLDVEFVSLVDRAAVRDSTDPTEPQRFLLWKRESGATNDAPDKGGTMTKDELSAALEKAETERDEAADRIAKLEEQVQELHKAAEAAVEETTETEPIDKSELPPAVVARLEKLEKAEHEANERLAKAEELAKAERDARVEREFIGKAELIPHVAGDTKEFGPVLKRAFETLTKEDFDLLQQRLEAADEQISKGDLFKQVGAGGDGLRDGDEGDLLRKVEDLQKSEGLSATEAYRRAATGEAGRRYLQSVR